MAMLETVSRMLMSAPGANRHQRLRMTLTGNIHINVIAEQFDKEIEHLLEPFIYKVVCTSSKLPAQSKLSPLSLTDVPCAASYRGSISAEHGIGSMKPQHLHYSKDPVSIRLMQEIKRVFDARGIMNPGKVVPQ